VLNAFNAPNDAYQVPFEELTVVPCPFIAHAPLKKDDFVVVHQLSDQSVTISNNLWNHHRLDIAEFKKMYQGVVLVAQKGERKTAVSPADAGALAKLRLPMALTGFAAILCVAVLAYTPWLNTLNWPLGLLTLAKTLGLVTSILLLVQSIDRNNPLVQKICGGGPNANCNAVLGSPAANVFKGLSWSEVGFFYFAGTWLALLFCSANPFALFLLAVLNLLSLPYTIYSIYYQARVIKQWCKLCCTVQALLWVEFAFLLLHYKGIPVLPQVQGLPALAICLALPVFIWLALKPALLMRQQNAALKKQLNKFKYDSKLFNNILTAQPKYALPAEEWSIVLGNPNAANVITMVTYPWCPPCSGVHKQLDALLDENPNLQARIVLTSRHTDGEDQTNTTRHLLALAALPDKQVIKNALHDWYTQKQKSYAQWAKKYPVHLNGAEAAKLEAHNDWCKMAGIKDTPTILLNGYFLPRMYQLPDIKYMLG
jgi:uncharacterized membrane protein